MYERMLNKQEVPTFDDLIRHSGDSGDSGDLWLQLDKNMEEKYSASKKIRFPYGKDYGWSAKYSIKSKHICDVFAENGAFTALFQVTSAAIETVYEELDTYAKDIWENKNPCKGGGWIEYRVLNQGQLQDLEKIIHAKATVRAK